MAGWFQRLVGGKPPRGGRFKGLLAGYPPYRIPHPGHGWTLTPAQAEANLSYLLDHKAERLRVVCRLLTEFGLDLDAALVAPDPKPFLDALWRWSIEEWPAVYDRRLATLDTWLNSTRDGPDIVLSVLMDVAIAQAELVLVRRPDYGWTLDLDPANKGEIEGEGTKSWQRPVLLRPADRIVPALRFDLEGAVWNDYTRCTSSTYAMWNHMGQGVLDIISGTHEACWRKEAGARKPT